MLAHAAIALAVLWQGPALAGEAVAWADESHGAGSIHVWTPRSGDRVVHRSTSLALTRPFAISRTRLAFERSYPGCPPPSGHVCPQGTDAVIGPLTGPYRILVKPRTCYLPGLGNALALDGPVVAYIELDCTRQRLRIVVRPRVVHDASIASGCCRGIALAGRYVAWSDGPEVVVFDWRARRVAYRARLGRTNVDFGFDLQRDGKLAVAFRSAQTGPTRIAWLSPSRPFLSALPFRGTDTRVRIADDHIAFQRLLSRNRSALVVADLDRSAHTIARFARPTRLRGFDFDGRRIAWASDRVTARRVDCPPPGQGRPCVRRESGVTSVLVRTRATRLIARLRFEDASAR